MTSAPKAWRDVNITEDSIPGLIRKIAVPASVGYFFNTMYNFVDTYFAGKISTDALAALSLSFPVFFIIIATGSGIGQGATALIANALGASEHGRARHCFSQAVVFCMIAGFVLTIAGWLAAPALFRLLGADDEYLKVCLAYMNVIVMGSVFFLLQSTLVSVLNAQGDTKVFRNVLVVSFFANCVLDPWFLFGGFGVPALGISGLALATVVIQIAGCAYILRHVRRTEVWTGMSAADFKPVPGVLRAIAGQALPASLNMLTVALGIFVITWFASQFSKEAVAAYGIATRIEQMVLLPTIGLNFAVLTLVGQNNGAKRPDRVREAWSTCIRHGITMMIAGGVIVWLTRHWMMTRFTDDATVIRSGADYLAVAAITLCSYVILFQTVFMLQGLKKPMFGLWIGLYRQVVAPVILYHLLAFTLGWGLWGLWWGICIVTWSAAIITLFYGRMMLARITAASV
jgi:putative MATE family efflux protein